MTSFVALITMLLFFGLLGILTIGAALIVIGLIFGVGFARAVSKRRPDRLPDVLLGGALLGLGLSGLLLSISQGPLVKCLPDGSAQQVSSLLGAQASYPFQWSASDHITRGTIVANGKLHTFRCQNGRLVFFG